MTHIVALQADAHHRLRVDAEKIEQQGACERMVPVVTSEFLKLVTTYPILFSKHAETGQFLCTALLGFDAGENLFWQKQRWDAIYVPLNIQRQPFFISGDLDTAVLCIDQHSPCLNDTKGERLFTDEGEETVFLHAAKTRLAELIKGEKDTQEFIQQLLALQLLTPLALDIRFANGDTRNVKGLYTIDETRLEQLNGEQLAALHAKGRLKLIYTLIASLGQIYALIDRKNQRLMQPQSRLTTPA